MARPLLVIGLIAVLIEIALTRPKDAPPQRWRAVGQWVLAGFAVVNLLLVAYLFLNHLNFPLNLEAMEGAMLQHFQRAVAFQPIYTDPSPSFVAFAYNPFYYVVSIPFGLIFGVNLVTLRMVSIVAFIGSALIVYAVIHRRTQSIWWALITVGLFAAAYATMDVYLDGVHPDSTFLFFAMLGSYLIDRSPSRAWNWVGVICLLLSFWTKQHGALFVVGGLLFLTWRDGFVKSLRYWLTAVILGPAAYLIAGPLLFGPRFIYFTWEVPRNWTTINKATFTRYFGYIVASYFPVAIAAILEAAYAVYTDVRKRRKQTLTIWHIQLVFGLLSGLMGAFDPGSANNVFIPMGMFFILVGSLGLHRLVTEMPLAQRFRLHQIALVFTFFILFYNPAPLVIAPTAAASFNDMVATLNKLDGPVYAPSLGSLQRGFTFSPSAHWVALEDIIRGPGRDERDNPKVEALLEPATHPAGSAYILSNHPLATGFPWLAFLSHYYVLQTDYGERYSDLKTLPRRFNDDYPRYLYRYDPAAANQQNDTSNTF